MKPKLKKITLGVALAGLSGVASAAMYTPPSAPARACAAGSVSVPCERSAWDIGLDLMLMQANSGANMYFANIQTTSGTTTTNNMQELKPKTQGGFRLEGSYHFSSGNDLDFSWMHSSKKTDSTVVDTNGTSHRTNLTSADTFRGHSNIQFDNVHGEFGQALRVGNHVRTRMHAGLSYARVKFLTAVRSWVSSATTTYDDHQNDSRFNGFGPRIGMDTCYSFHNGFKVLAKAATALYVGTSKDTSTFTDVNGTVNATVITHARHRVLVPSVEARVGLNYTRSFGEGDLSFEAGYHFANYFGAVQSSVNPSVTAATSGSSGTVTFDNRSFAVHGPYIGLKWLGNV